MSSIQLKTLARVVIYPLVVLLVGLGLGFAAYPQVVGHKLWLISWAYQTIFHPPKYDAEAVTKIARMRLETHWGGKPGFRVLDWRDFGEEAREFLVELTGEDGKPTQTIIRIWVRWKPWAMNNGDGVILYSVPNDVVVYTEIVSRDWESSRTLSLQANY